MPKQDLAECCSSWLERLQFFQVGVWRGKLKLDVFAGFYSLVKYYTLKVVKQDLFIP
jgi:hypothetical protein